MSNDDCSPTLNLMFKGDFSQQALILNYSLLIAFGTIVTGPTIYYHIKRAHFFPIQQRSYQLCLLGLVSTSIRILIYPIAGLYFTITGVDYLKHRNLFQRNIFFQNLSFFDYWSWFQIYFCYMFRSIRNWYAFQDQKIKKNWFFNILKNEYILLLMCFSISLTIALILLLNPSFEIQDWLENPLCYTVYANNWNSDSYFWFIVIHIELLSLSVPIFLGSRVHIPEHYKLGWEAIGIILFYFINNNVYMYLALFDINNNNPAYYTWMNCLSPFILIIFSYIWPLINSSTRRLPLKQAIIIKQFDLFIIDDQFLQIFNDYINFMCKQSEREYGRFRTYMEFFLEFQMISGIGDNSKKLYLEFFKDQQKRNDFPQPIINSIFDSLTEFQMNREESNQDSDTQSSKNGSPQIPKPNNEIVFSMDEEKENFENKEKKTKDAAQDDDDEIFNYYESNRSNKFPSRQLNLNLSFSDVSEQIEKYEFNDLFEYSFLSLKMLFETQYSKTYSFRYIERNLQLNQELLQRLCLFNLTDVNSGVLI